MHQKFHVIRSGVVFSLPSKDKASQQNGLYQTWTNHQCKFDIPHGIIKIVNLQVQLATHEQRLNVPRFDFEGFGEVHDGVFSLLLHQVNAGSKHVILCRLRVGFDGLLDCCDGFIKFLGIGKCFSNRLLRHRVCRIDGNQCSKIFDCHFRLVRQHVDQTAGAKGIRIRPVQFDRFGKVLKTLVFLLREPTEDHVAFGEFLWVVFKNLLRLFYGGLGCFSITIRKHIQLRLEQQSGTRLRLQLDHPLDSLECLLTHERPAGVGRTSSKNRLADSLGGFQKRANHELLGKLSGVFVQTLFQCGFTQLDHLIKIS